MQVKEGDIFRLKKVLSIPDCNLEIGYEMCCIFAHHADRRMENIFYGETNAIIFSMDEGREYPYFWDYFESKIERRKRIINNICK